MKIFKAPSLVLPGMATEDMNMSETESFCWYFPEYFVDIKPF